jgi:arylsulfatase A-like enzyme
MGLAAYIDYEVGRLLTALKALDYEENTIIVFTSDHGEIMGAHGVNPKQKQVPWIESAGVPFLIHWPAAQERQDRIINMPITTPDISATLLALAGLKIPDSFEGNDFSKIIIGEEEIPDHGAMYMSVAPFARVKKEFKREYRALKTCRYSYVKSIDGPWLLFDDLNDPYQMNNLVGNPEFKDIQKHLEEQLMDELNKITDDFRPAASYLKEWGYEVTENGHIPYKMHNQEKVQSPRRK